MTGIDSMELYPVRKPMKLRQIGWVSMALWHLMEQANPGNEVDWRKYPEAERLRYFMLVRMVWMLIGFDCTIQRSIPHHDARYAVTEGIVKQSELARNVQVRGFSLN